MRLTFDARQNIRHLVAVFGISLAFIVAQTAPALAAGADPDRDGHRSSIERNVTETNPFKADSDRDGLEDGDEDDDCDELEDEDDEDDDNDGGDDNEDEDDQASPILDQQSLK
jgi:hypothetical protein